MISHISASDSPLSSASAPASASASAPTAFALARSRPQTPTSSAEGWAASAAAWTSLAQNPVPTTPKRTSDRAELAVPGVAEARDDVGLVVQPLVHAGGEHPQRQAASLQPAHAVGCGQGAQHGDRRGA